jgi:hypothetical protein
MKNKLRFIMPRLVGITVVAGFIALIVATVFKLLLGITILAGAVAIIVRSFGKCREQLAQHPLGPMARFGNSSVWDATVQPVSGYSTAKGTSIVPID